MSLTEGRLDNIHNPQQISQEVSPLDNLPVEIVINILIFLDKPSLYQLYQALPLYRVILNQSYFWHLRGGSSDRDILFPSPFNRFTRNLMIFDGSWNLPEAYKRLLYSSQGRDLTVILNRQLESKEWISCISGTFITLSCPYYYSEIEILGIGPSHNYLNFSFGITSHLPAIHDNCPCSYQCNGYRSKENNLPDGEYEKYQLVNSLNNPIYSAYSFLGDGELLVNGEISKSSNLRWKAGDRISFLLDYPKKVITFYYNHQEIHSYGISPQPFYLYISMFSTTSARLVSPTEAYQSLKIILK